jgi:GT2 family glycosyltransferase
VEGPGPADERVTVVIITRNRCAELRRTLDRMTTLPERPAIVVLDNASDDETTAMARQCFPSVQTVRLERNCGAVARNLGVMLARTPYVAFCDDDVWWDPGAIRLAADALDAHVDVAVVVGRIMVEPAGTVDPIVRELKASPVPGPARLPGPALVSFLAGVSMVRAGAFTDAGGFSARLWLGGEEELLAIDLATQGWYLCFLDDVVVHHQPSSTRENRQRRHDGIRNTLWFTWLRRPLWRAVRRTVVIARSVPPDRVSLSAFGHALAGLGWVLRERRVVPPRVEAAIRLVEDEQLASGTRRYVD